MKNIDINTRIKQLIENLNVGQNEFARNIGISSSRISNITSGRNKPDSEMLQKISLKYRNVSIEWILTGIGNWEKILTEYSKVTESSCQVKNCDFIALIDKKDKQMMEMSQEIGKLKQELATLKKGGSFTPYNYAPEP